MDCVTPTIKPDADILIMGGGLAGSSIALHLKKLIPHYSITLITSGPLVQDAGFGAVGESTVEVASHYFAELLGLRDHLESAHLPKLGLRYFLESDCHDSIQTRLEVGGNSYAYTKTYQIDRATLENKIIEEFMLLGGSVIDHATVKNADFNTDLKLVSYYRDKTLCNFTSSWLIDASGRSGLLRKKLKLHQKIDHNCSAAWWRLKGEHKIDFWSSDTDWRSRNGLDNARWFSTNHLMGRGYWVWIIPLSCNVTSFGVVFDSEIHSADQFNKYDKMLEWLNVHEPQLATLCKDNSENFQDFGFLRNYSYTSSQFFSPDGWFLTGEAGAFVDPLYSPGSDFIAMSNTYIADIIHRASKGEQVKYRTEIYNTIYSRFLNSTLNTFKGQYKILGNPEVLPVKIFWDWCFYWNFIARLFFEDKLTDLAFLQTNSGRLSELEALGEEMQALFSNWDSLARPPARNGFLDLARHPYLFDLNKSLSMPTESLSAQVKFQRGIEDLRNISEEIRIIVSERRSPDSSASGPRFIPVISPFYEDLKEFLL